MKGKIWGHSRIKRFLAGLSAMTILAGTIPFAAYGSLTMAAHAEEAGTGEQEENPFLVSSATTKFNLTGGIMNDSSFVSAMAYAVCLTMLNRPAFPIRNRR